jgi:hypothetical protein
MMSNKIGRAFTPTARGGVESSDGLRCAEAPALQQCRSVALISGARRTSFKERRADRTVAPAPIRRGEQVAA